MTYMNRSGIAVRSLTDYLGIDPSETLVGHDDLDSRSASHGSSKARRRR